MGRIIGVREYKYAMKKMEIIARALHFLLLFSIVRYAQDNVLAELQFFFDISSLGT